jgi:two-component system, cell cycle sensor histidine kinase and response regulator CckA
VTDEHDTRAFTGESPAEPRSVVIVVDDDAAFRWLLSEALTNGGFEVLTAADGMEALELYRKNAGRVWLVVADVIMPEMDGLTAATEMRKIDKNVSFIFMSGYDSERIDRIGIQMKDIPCSEFLRKPFAFKEMMRRMRTLERERKGPHNAI